MWSKYVNISIAFHSNMLDVGECNVVYKNAETLS